VLDLHPPLLSRAVLIDDVITKGATLLGAALCLQEAYPHIEIRAIAIVRTLGRRPDIERIKEPCIGRVRLVGAEAERIDG
jgi:adenine/guanine phosphoribosyltransferase-like PRPP-binding protein